jgi:hypothetical protein
MTEPPTPRDKYRALTGAFLVVLLTATALMMGTLVYLAVRNGQLITTVRQGNARLVDCTTPGGKCYERGNRQTGQAVTGITDVELAANYCAAQLTRPFTDAKFAVFTECVKQRVPHP